MWDKRSEYVSNYDGDTVKMILDQGFGDTKEIDVRLLGVPAPEKNEPGGLECQQFVENWFKSRVTTKTRWNFIVITSRMKVADREQMSFTRYIGTITSIDGKDNLNFEIANFRIINGYGGGVGS